MPLKGKGTTIEVEIATVFTKVSDVTAITPAQISQAVYTYENLEDAAVRKMGSGQPDGGQVQIKVNYAPTSPTHQFLIAQSRSPDPVNFRYTFSDGNAEPFAAVVSGWAKDEVQPKERVTGTFTLDVDGLVTEPTP